MRYIYIDESRITPKDRYQLFGSLWLPRDKQEEFREQYWKLWDRHFPSRRSELKWTKVSNSKLKTYKAFVDFFAGFYPIDFRCVVLDRRTIDYKEYHESDKELGFYKFLYFFISRNIEKDYSYRSLSDYYQIFLDSRRQTNEIGRLSDLKNVLNNRLNGKCYRIEKPIIRNVEAEPDSKLSPEIQIIDILLGAVGYSWEGFQTSPAKLNLIEYIENFFGLKLNASTPYLSDKINIWEFRLQGKTKSALLPTPPKGLDVH